MATSVAIAILAAFVALSISGRIVAATTRRARYAWASAGAISMGGGIWSMHFVGMLAFSLPCGITYEPVGTVFSIIPGMLASGIALSTISKPDEPSLSRLFVSAVLMGGEQRRRDFVTERLRSLEVEHELEFGGPHGQQLRPHRRPQTMTRAGSSGLSDSTYGSSRSTMHL